MIKLLKFKQFKSLFFIFIKHPIFIYPTLKATSASMLMAQKEFPNIHGKNNKANAFRHALWNILLVQELLKWNKNKMNAIQFTNIVTTWHEDFSPNKPLEKAMDLHNNEVGRGMIKKLLEDNLKPSKGQIASYLNQKLALSVKIAKIEAVKQYPNTLIYLED